MKCVICKQAETRHGVTTVTFERGDSVFVVKEVPAQVCPNCGEDYVDSAVTAELLRSAEDLAFAGSSGRNRLERHQAMMDSARYRKIVEWSEEDKCFVGRAPDLMLGGCHGLDERAVFDELCQIVEEWIEMYRRDGKPLPPASRPETSRAARSEKRTGPRASRTAARRGAA